MKAKENLRLKLNIEIELKIQDRKYTLKIILEKVQNKAESENSL